MISARELGYVLAWFAALAVYFSALCPVTFWTVDMADESGNPLLFVATLIVMIGGWLMTCTFLPAFRRSTPSWRKVIAIVTSKDLYAFGPVIAIMMLLAVVFFVCYEALAIMAILGAAGNWSVIGYIAIWVSLPLCLFGVLNAVNLLLHKYAHEMSIDLK